ncbi:MAG: menaquinone biosynthesis protein [Pirellulaceae bacterium]|jgi:chorismate dehydratase|nr:menaquinone biosynthesis protein [Pirellulaceae bacterium]MDP7015219.1 menaquinone biosynthesis protein [Pirellulaceae bacterium]
MKCRIGAVSYLNTKPLVHGLTEFAPDCDISFDLPSRLADQLAGGELDVALVPSVEFLRGSDYSIISDACIGTRGPVLSVKLLSRTEIPAIRSLALDEGSRTSAALVRILLKQQYGIAPALTPLPIGSDARDSTADAVLLIGDRAMHADSDQYAEIWDLGERWREWSGLPFVFAMWVARCGVDVDGIAAALSAARDAGLANLDSIARREHQDVGLSYETCLSYLRDNLHFTLGDDERKSLELFASHVNQLDSVLTN